MKKSALKNFNLNIQNENYSVSYCIILTLFFFFVSVSLTADIVVPYSNKRIITKQNQITGFVCVSPNDSTSCPLKTKILTWHEGSDLHLYWKAEIDENFREGKFAKQDHWVEADYLSAQIVTDVTNYYAYMYFAFPLGSKYDGIRESDLDYDSDWNSTYDYKNDISDSLWICHMIIPFEDLRFFGKPPYRWKIILSRWLCFENEFYSVPYVTLNMDKDYFRRAENLLIKNKIKKSKNYRIHPYFIQKYDLKNSSSDFDFENFGLDFSFDPNFATKLKFSLNPDYSDVPMDSEEDIYNLRYPPTFPENRYFFIEDMDVFGVNNHAGETIFYSRNIMQPQYAFKITGDSEKFSYGFLSAKDKKVTDNGVTTNDDDFYNLAAYNVKHNKYKLQFTFLNKMNRNYHNEILHFASEWEILARHNLWSSLNFSFRDKNTDVKSGYYTIFGYNGHKKDLGWSVYLSRINEDFYADMGWIHKRDIFQINFDIWNEYEYNDNIIKNFGWYIWGHRESENIKSDLLNQYSGINMWINTRPRFDVWTNFRLGREGYKEDSYDWYRMSAGISWEYFDWLEIDLDYGRWNTLVYELENTYKSDGIDFEVSLDLSRYTSLKFEVSKRIYYNYPDSSKLDNNYLICNSKLEINLSNDLSLTNGLRFNNYEHEDQTQHIGFFSNLCWQFKPESNIYLGYKLSTDEIDNRFNSNYEIFYFKITYLF